MYLGLHHKIGLALNKKQTHQAYWHGHLIVDLLYKSIICGEQICYIYDNTIDNYIFIVNNIYCSLYGEILTVLIKKVLSH